MLQTYHCPNCSRLLQASGELIFAGQPAPVFQCDHCTRRVEMFGVEVDVALTFIVGPDGRPHDPNDD